MDHLLPPPREPPADVAVEMALLGSLLVDNRAFADVDGIVSAEAFADTAHQRIYSAIKFHCDAGRPATATTLRRQFEADDTLQDIGGGRYLAELAAGAANIIDAVDYARMIRDLWLRRVLIERATQSLNALYDPTDQREVWEISAALTHDVDKIVRDSGAELEEARPIGAAIDDMLAWVQSGEKPRGCFLGFSAVDRECGPITEGKLWTVGARTGMGKTIFAQTVAWNAARADKKVYFVSLEMGEEDLVFRIVGGAAEVETTRLIANDLDADEKTRLVYASETYHHLGIRIDDNVAICGRIETLTSRLRSVMDHDPQDLIIIDYVGLMTSDYVRKSGQGKVAELEEITRTLKQIARQLHVPILLLAQINRGVEQREDKRPTLADIRSSGSIEQDSDCVLFLYREAYYLEKSEPDPADADKWEEWRARLDRVENKAELIVAKHRYASGRTIPLGFDGPRSRFTSWSEATSADYNQWRRA